MPVKRMEQFVKRNAIEVVGISYPVNTDTFQHNMRRNTSEKKKKKAGKKENPQHCRGSGNG